MSNCSYRLLQLDNSNIGAVAAPVAPATSVPMPLGVITREVSCDKCNSTFKVTTTANNAVYIYERGYYAIDYTAYLTVAAAGTITINLVLNGVIVKSATITVAAAGTYAIPIHYVTRVLSNCRNMVNAPVLVQITNSGIALTGGTSGLTVQRMYDDN